MDVKSQNRQPRRNPLETMNDNQLLKRYRLNKAGIEYVTEIVRSDIEHKTNYGGSLSPEVQVMVR